MKKIIIFTDGSCLGNGQRTTYAGYGIHFPNNEMEDVSEQFTSPPLTNQRAELFAIYQALTMTLDQGYEQISLYTDSDYSIKSITVWADGWKKRGWKTTKGRVKNLDLIKPLYELYKAHSNRIQLKHVRAHTGKQDFYSLGNAAADRLAVMGSQKMIGKKRSSEKSASMRQSKLNPKPDRVVIKRRRKRIIIPTDSD